LAQRKLGQNTEAESTLRALVEAANRVLEPNRTRDDASGSAAERRAARDRDALAHYLAGLGHLGLGDAEKAKQEFTLALKARPDHLGAKTELAQLEPATPRNEHPK
jgi:hypothetical protein